MILITGASGFIATHIARLLVQEGHKVTLQTRGHRIDNNLVDNGLVTLHRSCIHSLSADELGPIEAIIHLASAGVSPKKATWEELEEVNIRGTLKICQIAHQLQAKLVVAGSFAEYGNSGSRYDQIPVDAPLEPTFPYAVSKAAGCSLSLGYARSMNTPLAYLRIFNAFGEGQDESNLWPSLIKAANAGEDYEMTKGEQIRDFISVEEVAKQFLHAATILELKNGRPYVKNIGSGDPTTVRTFVEHWWEKSNASGDLKIGALPYRANEVMKFIPSLEASYL